MLRRAFVSSCHHKCECTEAPDFPQLPTLVMRVEWVTSVADLRASFCFDYQRSSRDLWIDIGWGRAKTGISRRPCVASHWERLVLEQSLSMLSGVRLWARPSRAFPHPLPGSVLAETPTAVWPHMVGLRACSLPMHVARPDHDPAGAGT